MTKFILHFHKFIITLVCLALMIIMMMSSSHFISRQQTEFSGQINNVIHQFIRQSTYSLGPLIHRYNTAVDDGQQINAILNNLVKHPWVIEAALYQLNGELIAKTDDKTSQVTLNTATIQPKSTNPIEIVEKIDLLESPVGFIKLTIDTELLVNPEDSLSYTTNMVWLMMVLSTLTGMILVLSLSLLKKSSGVDNK